MREELRAFAREKISLPHCLTVKSGGFASLRFVFIRCPYAGGEGACEAGSRRICERGGPGVALAPMATVHFTARLGALLPAEQAGIDGATVREVLARIFAQHSQARGYVLDEQGRLRRHVCIFLDGERLVHEQALAAPVGRHSEIYVMQALSGG